MTNKEYLSSLITELKENNKRMKESVRNRENIYRNTDDKFSKRSHRRQIDILNASINANKYVIEALEIYIENTEKENTEKIRRKLIELGFKVNSKGFLYWIEAIQYAQKKCNEYKMGEVYNYIAEKYNDTYIRVERALRFSRIPANSNIQQEFRLFRRVSNQKFLDIIKLSNFEQE